MRNVLVIDDQQNNLTIIKALFKDHLPECGVITALSAEQGFALAKKKHPDTILLDNVAPSLNTYDLCRKLKADNSTKNIPIIMVTAINAGSKSRIKGLEAGADAFLSMPIDPVDLSAQIYVMFRIKEAEDKLLIEKELLDEKIKQKTNELLESEEKYRAIVENSHDAIYIYKDEKFLFVNNKICELSGFSKKELYELVIWNLIHPDDRERIERYSKDRAKGKKVQSSYSARIITKKGAVRNCEFSVRLIKYKGTFAVLGAVVDVTKRLEADMALKASEEKLRLIIDNSPIGFSATDLEGNFIDVNPALCHILGYTREEMIHKHFNYFTHPDDCEQNRTPYMQLVKGEISYFDLEKRYVSKSGEIIHALIRSQRVCDDSGKPLFEFAITEDISERKIALNALRKSEKTYKTIFENTGTATIIIESDMTISLANAKFQELVGYNRKEIDGQMKWSDFIVPDDLEKIKILLSLKREEKISASEKHEFKVINRNNEIKNILMMTAVIPGTKKSIASLLDITERKRSEKQIEEKSLELKNQFVKSEKQRVANLVILKDLNKATKILKSEILERKLVEKALQSSEQLNRTVIENSPIGISVRDKNGTLLLSNKAWKKIWHISDEDILNYNIPRKKLEFNSKDSYLGEHFKHVQNVYQNGGEYYIPELNLPSKRKDYSGWISQYFYAIRSEEGDVQSVVILTDDITVRKQAKAIQTTLYSISNAVNTTDNMNDLYSQIREHLGEILDTTNFYVAFYDKATDSLSFEYHIDKQENIETFPAGKTLTKYVIDTGKPLYATKDVVNKLIDEGVIEDVGASSEIWLGVPLKNENGIFGVVAVQSYTNPKQYSKKDIDILTFISEEIALAIQHKQAEEQIKRNLEEKRTLLKELYHRTKNNMQVISSLLRMQVRSLSMKGQKKIQIGIIEEIFKEVVNRINTMSLVHQKLYQANNLSRISLRDYIRDLISLLTQSYSQEANKISFNLDIEEMFVSIDTAIPVGLVFNEIISNSFKHAFPDDMKGEISIRLTKDDNNYINVYIEDNGIGIPAEIDLRKAESMGLHTMFTLVLYQLKGKIDYHSDKGLKWHLKLRDDLNKERV